MMNFDENIAEIEKRIGYVFRDKALLRQAFTRESYCNEANRLRRVGYQSNEVLEFFGDSILSAVIVTCFIKKKTERYSYGIRSELCEGDFSNIRSKLADKKNLSENITRLGLEKYFLMGEGDAKLGIWNERSVKEDLFESIIGAIYIDSGFDMSAAAVWTMPETAVMIALCPNSRSWWRLGATRIIICAEPLPTQTLISPRMFSTWQILALQS